MGTFQSYIRSLLLLSAFNFIVCITACTGATGTSSPLGSNPGGITPIASPTPSSLNAANTSSSGTVSSSTDPGFLDLEEKELLYKGLIFKLEGEKLIQAPDYSSTLMESHFDSQKNVSESYAWIKRLIPKINEGSLSFEETPCIKICQNRYLRVIVYGTSFPFDPKLNLEEDVDVLMAKINKGDFDRSQFSFIDLPIQNDGKVLFQNFKLKKYGAYTFLLLPINEAPVNELTPLTEEVYNKWLHWEEYRVLREGRIIEFGSDKNKPKTNFPLFEKMNLHSVLSEIHSESEGDE
ncbi:MAG: hypothetical protein JNK65_07755 [Deltaproteobacteria bacterium]|nr:hypothetical protein [Deltaproteobacteria bacterium]